MYVVKYSKKHQCYTVDDNKGRECYRNKAKKRVKSYLASLGLKDNIEWRIYE